MLRTPSLDNDLCGMLVEVFSNPICLDGDDGSLLLLLSSSIIYLVSGRLMLLSSDVAPLISNSLTFLVQQSIFFHGDVIIIINSLNIMMVLPLKFKIR